MSSHGATKINQKEYLKKYLSGDKEKKKKKKDKKHKKSATVKIIDDDACVNNDEELDEDFLLGGEDAPIIVAEYIEERPSGVSKWKSIAVKDEPLDDDKPTVKQEPVDESDLWGRKADRSQVSPKQGKRRDDPPPSRVRRNSDNSLRRRRRKSSDNSPPRKNSRRSKSKDFSPRRRIKEEPGSPKQNIKHEPRSKTPEAHKSTQRKMNDMPRDQSPPRRRQTDLSPPRRRERNVSSDQSPPRRRQKDASSDQSPPRRRHQATSRGQSPSNRRRRDSPTDKSPPRRRERNAFRDQSPVRKKARSSSNDQSPPRRRDRSESPRRRQRRDSPRKQSPQYRRRERSRSQSPRRVDARLNCNQSPPIRKSRWAKVEPEKSLSPPPTHAKHAKTLDGKKAGLQDAQALKTETAERRRQEEKLFKQMSREVSGRDAEVQVRSTGRRGQRARDAAAEDPEERRRKEEAEKKKKEQYDRWGKGLKQIEMQRERQEEMLHEANKPLARYANDDDLDRHLREKEHADDPMLEYIRQKRKKREKEERLPTKPVYEGPYPENRFGIRPGYRWDGVDRSNGYEQRWFDKQNERKARQDEAYKYSVEDM